MRNIYSALLRKYRIIFIAGSVRFSNDIIKFVLHIPISTYILVCKYYMYIIKTG